jgi:hypothetical protein
MESEYTTKELKAIIDERDRLYMMLFTEKDKAVAVALSSKGEDKNSTHWNIGVIVSIAVALAGALLAILKH